MAQRPEPATKSCDEACAGLMLSLFIPALGLAAQPHVEEIMLVAGTITLNPDGGLRGAPARHYGQLNTYLPVPVQNIPWDQENASGTSDTSADAIASGGLFVRDTWFVLKTALADGGSRS